MFVGSRPSEQQAAVSAGRPHSGSVGTAHPGCLSL